MSNNAELEKRNHDNVRREREIRVRMVKRRVHRNRRILEEMLLAEKSSTVQNLDENRYEISRSRTG